MMIKNNHIVDSMIDLLETITDKRIDLSDALLNNPDFDSFLKDNSSIEMGGHIPQRKLVENIKCCVNPDFANEVIKSS